MVVVIDLAGWLCFFVGAAIDLGIGRAMSLAIGETVSTGTDVAIGFSELSLW